MQSALTVSTDTDTATAIVIHEVRGRHDDHVVVPIVRHQDARV